MKGYKGFSPGLVCRGKQYAENTVFEEDSAEICKSGMHFCENPFDVLDHYGFINDKCELNEFAEVESLAESKTDDGKKYCTQKLKIGAKIGIPGLVNAFAEYTLSRADCGEHNTGDYSAATNTGNRSAATNTGYRSAATNTGYQSAATNTGDQSAATNTGRGSAATNTGNRSAATNTGYQSAATNTGNRSAATNTGNRSAAKVEGFESFAIATGIGGKACGKIGCYIAVAEWVRTECGYKLAGFQTAMVDGEKIKEDTFYSLKNGEFVEVDSGNG